MNAAANSLWMNTCNCARRLPSRLAWCPENNGWWIPHDAEKFTNFNRHKRRLLRLHQRRIDEWWLQDHFLNSTEEWLQYKYVYVYVYVWIYNITYYKYTYRYRRRKQNTLYDILSSFHLQFLHSSKLCKPQAMIFLQKWLLLAAFPWFLSASSEPSEPEADEPSPIADAPEGMRPEELRRLHRKLDRNGDGKVGISWDECVGGVVFFFFFGCFAFQAASWLLLALGQLSAEHLVGEIIGQSHLGAPQEVRSDVTRLETSPVSVHLNLPSHYQFLTSLASMTYTTSIAGVILRDHGFRTPYELGHCKSRWCWAVRRIRLWQWWKSLIGGTPQSLWLGWGGLVDPF